MFLQDLRERVLEANLALPREGLVAMTSGNASGRDPDRGLVVIKPSGVPYGQLRPETLVVVDPDGDVVDGELRPSIDTSAHLEVDLGQQFEVVADLVVVPGPKDLFDAGEVLVDGRTADSGLVGDLGHGDVQRTAFGCESGGSLQDRVANLTAMRLDRRVPQLRHDPTIHSAGYRTLRSEDYSLYRKDGAAN